MKKITQFEIWEVNLNPTKGSEQAGIRPALIIETNATENKGQTTIIIPFTSNIKKIYSLDIVFEPNSQNGLSVKSKLKFRHIRVIDKIGLIKKLGKIKEETGKQQILKTLKLLFDFEGMFI